MEYRTIIKQWSSVLKLLDADNFKQAERVAFEGACTRESGYIPDNVKKIFASPLSEVPEEGVTTDQSDFWVVVRALKLFVQKYNNGSLPVSCADFPDMVSSTSAYLALRQVYIEQHEQDLNKI